MKKIFSIGCIIFLIGITSVVPYYSTSYFVYAEENQEQLSDDEIIQAGLSVYLNTRNGFITIANGTVNGAKVLMNNTIDTFIDYYNVNHTIQEQISKSSLAGNILVNYNPFRVSLKGSAISFFNSLYSYLEDEGKVPNASGSNGGNTTDTLYEGYLNGNSLYYIVNGNLTLSGQNYNGSVSKSNVTPGTAWAGNNFQYCVNYYNTMNNITMDYNTPYTNASQLSGFGSGKSFSVTFPAQDDSQNQNVVTSNLVLKLDRNKPNSPSLFFDGIPSSGFKNGIYGNLDSKFRGNFCLMHINRTNNPPLNAAGVITYNYTNSTYYIQTYKVYSSSHDAAGTTAENIKFETTDFDDQPMEVPEGDQEVELTPRDSDNNQTFNTYNEYVNNYVIKKTYITNNNSGGGNEDPENPAGGTVPDWSGGGGSGTITPDGNGGFTFELPDFSLPDLDIDWSISGLSEKFPFSIPFDLLAFFTVLNSDPETPAIEATIPLGLWEWEIDWDLHNFDTLAALLRNLEFIGFCIGLALITRNIIKG